MSDDTFDECAEEIIRWMNPASMYQRTTGYTGVAIKHGATKLFHEARQRLHLQAQFRTVGKSQIRIVGVEQD
jgi:hypothetical protein